MRTYTRRQAMVMGTAVGGGLVAAMLSVPIIGFLLYPVFHERRVSWVTVGPVDDVPVGIPTPFQVAVPTGEGWPVAPQNRIVYVTKYDDGTMAAFSNICSHMQCDVHWDPNLGQFLCPCHGGLYNIHGRNIGGPPPSPLPEWVHRTHLDEQGRTILQIQNALNEDI